MQIILTEEEYNLLKNKADIDKKLYVKRSDVMDALLQLGKDIGLDKLNPYDFQWINRWKTSVEKFINKIDGK